MVNPSAKIRFTIDAQGQVKIDISGIKGPSCEDILKQFQQLGLLQSNQPKLDYYEQPPLTIHPPLQQYSSGN